MANAYQPTYPTLVLEIQDLCENTNSEFVARIPDFIHRAQDQVQRDLGLAMWRQYLDTTIATTSLARNTDWLVVNSIWLSTFNVFLQQRHLDYVRMYIGIGRPKVWAEDQEGTILIGPTPNSTYLARVDFYQRLAALSSDNPSNWITRNAGDLLLLLAMANAASYLLSPERVQEFTGLYQAVQSTAMKELRDSERERYSPTRAAPQPTIQPGATA